MKLKQAYNMASHNYFTHVAVNKDKTIIMFYLWEMNSEPVINGKKWDYSANHNEADQQMEIGFYTGKKHWKDTLRKTDIGVKRDAFDESLQTALPTKKVTS